MRQIVTHDAGSVSMSSVSRLFQMNNRFFFQFGDKQVEWDDFEFTPLQAGSVVACADNAAFVRQACREGNPCVRRWAARRPELDVDAARHLVATEDPQIEFNRCRHYVCRNYAFLQRLSSRDLLALIGEKLVSLEDVLDALSESDLPLGELKQLGRELFENYDGPLTHGVLNPRIRSVIPDNSQNELRPLEGFSLCCGSLSIPLSAEEALELPNSVLNVLGLFEVLSEVDDPEIRRRVAIRRGGVSAYLGKACQRSGPERPASCRLGPRTSLSLHDVEVLFRRSRVFLAVTSKHTHDSGDQKREKVVFLEGA